MQPTTNRREASDHEADPGGQLASAPGRRFWVWPAVIILSGALTGLAYTLDVQGPARVVVALWFLLVCPGLPWVRLLHLRSRMVELPLIAALSLALDTIVATVFAYAGVWSTASCLLTLLGVSYVGAALLLLVQGQRRA